MSYHGARSVGYEQYLSDLRVGEECQPLQLGAGHLDRSRIVDQCELVRQRTQRTPLDTDRLGPTLPRPNTT